MEKFSFLARDVGKIGIYIHIETIRGNLENLDDFNLLAKIGIFYEFMKGILISNENEMKQQTEPLIFRRISRKVFSKRETFSRFGCFAVENQRNLSRSNRGRNLKPF